MQRIRIQHQAEPWLAGLLVTAVTILTYGPMIPYLGFYRDDWYLLWTAKTQGPEGILSLFRGDRPFLGWLYNFDYSFLGSAPLNWHIYALLIKIVGGLGCLWLLRSLWPEKRVETTFIALLFIVYPGFYQQPNAATFKNLLLAYAAAMFSLAFTIRALKSGAMFRRVGWTAAAVLLAAFYVFIFEALIGLEAARLVLVWYFWRQIKTENWRLTARRTLMATAPYLFFGLSFVFWRVFLFESTRRATNVSVVLGKLAPFSFNGILHIVVEAIKDIIETSILAWGVPYYQFSAGGEEYRVLVFSAVAAFLGVILVFAYRSLFRDSSQLETNPVPEPASARDWIWLGIVIIVVTTLPIILAGRNAIFAVQWDRYTYQSLIGVALFIGGISFHAVEGRTRWVFLGMLLMSGIVTQLLSANYYRKFWTAEREAMWQLSWRAPQINDGTTLILSLPGNYALAEEYEIWGPVNIIYRPGQPLRIPGQVVYDGLWLKLATGDQEERLVRGTILVKRDFAKVIIASQPSPLTCLHVLDGRRAEQSLAELSDVRAIAEYSNVSLIDTSPQGVIPPHEIFGSEPTRDWCYYYQKMDLARQQMDWQTAAALSDEAIAKGYEPVDVSEWLPALEAYIHTGNQIRAKRVALLIRVDKNLYQSLCLRLKSLQGEPAAYDRQQLADALCKRD